MRKTQNFLRRAGSAALALTLTVSLCQPAFAATKAPFSKDETVYAVMAADGSVTKTTVSEHLYNADGLAGVEDKSTLKNIVNTESFAEYTQNGDTLVWNTDDTDVYYKGDTDRQLPISAKVTYTLDGKTAPLSELLGQSGHLVLTIDLTNNETGKVTVNGKERTIVTPLVTAVGGLRHPAGREGVPRRLASRTGERRRRVLTGQCDRGGRRGVADGTSNPAGLRGECRGTGAGG